MQPRELIPDIFCVGAIDWDRRLFDSLIPLPDGTSYNSYLVKGKEKTALIDTVDPPKTDILEANLQAMDIKTIDYIITHHAEQDHSGALPRILEKYPEAKAVCTPRCKELLASLLAISEDRIVTVEDKESISLGGKTLEFIHFPWVHWPETMLSYLKEDRILFPCDLFGAHLAASDLYVTDEGQAYESAKRYYAEIMMPFRAPIKKNLAKIEPLDIEMIASSHGPVYDKPQFIVDAYKEWVGDQVKNEVVLAYISMHDSTRRMVEHFVDALIERNIKVRQFDLKVFLQIADSDEGLGHQGATLSSSLSSWIPEQWSAPAAFTL